MLPDLLDLERQVCVCGGGGGVGGGGAGGGGRIWCYAYVYKTSTCCSAARSGAQSDCSTSSPIFTGFARLLDYISRVSNPCVDTRTCSQVLRENFRSVRNIS